ncbi:Rieske (2Fe-2S) protein [Cecembia sp.]|uniref:Rieske (2Fe-2S) protein n=1 Tax=Cecembia sp. TaxID=1898110 RepID=UPI0025C3AE10|nr:Rieske (2Fe-2S) protein [Cecembia sp.]
MKTFILGRTKKEVERLVPEGQIKTVRLGNTKICMSRIADNYFAFEQACPHRKADLGKGTINKFKEVICPLHEYRFDLETGRCNQANCSDLKIFKTEISEEGLKIYMPN